MLENLFLKLLLMRRECVVPSSAVSILIFNPVARLMFESRNIFRFIIILFFYLQSIFIVNFHFEFHSSPDAIPLTYL